MANGKQKMRAVFAGFGQALLATLKEHNISSDEFKENGLPKECMETFMERLPRYYRSWLRTFEKE